MYKKIAILSLLLIVVLNINAKEYHVSKQGKDSNSGTRLAPFKTIKAASKVAWAGDTITVHEGTYREWVNPIRGGKNNNKRIIYRAAKGENVEIKGSEIITKWEKTENNLWKVTIPNTFFGNYNPYKDLIYGDWFDDYGRIHHTGEVFLNGKSLYEKESLSKLFNSKVNTSNPPDSSYVWYCESDEKNTTIWANFHLHNPNQEQVEISVRKTCFYPEKKGINYLTISGFKFSQAATQWAAPTAEQIGMIATHWNKGWIIENNTISDSKCVGISLGKERETGHNVWSADKTRDGSVLYIEVIFKALHKGWNKEKVGSHIIRNNRIYNCEQAGICGSFGGAFSVLENNYISDIWVKRQFGGEEMGGIKLHGAIDVVIKNNRLNNTGRALWLDWMSQGTRVSNNLMYNNDIHDIYIEVSHGPCLIDNNILGSPRSIYDRSQGSAFAHNLVLGKIHFRPDENRFTPYHYEHSTDIAGFSVVFGGDNRYYNNVFAGIYQSQETLGEYGTQAFNASILNNFIEGNIYYNLAKPYKYEKNYIEKSNLEMKYTFEEQGEIVYLNMEQNQDSPNTSWVTSKLLGNAKMSGLPYENPNGTSLKIDTDYFGKKRSLDNPVAGPFKDQQNGLVRVKIW